MSSCALNGADTQELAEGLRANTTLVNLDISDNAIGVLPIRDWLSSLRPRLADYADGFHEVGVEHSGELLELDRMELQEIYEEFGIRRLHQHLISQGMSSLEENGCDMTGLAALAAAIPECK